VTYIVKNITTTCLLEYIIIKGLNPKTTSDSGEVLVGVAESRYQLKCMIKRIRVELNTQFCNIAAVSYSADMIDDAGELSQ